jgi:exodeoxyribonuclease VII large subunit
MAEWRGLPFDDAPAPTAAPLSVGELTLAIKHILESSFGLVTVEGELSNCRRWSSGHIYFTLKDAGAQIRAVIFRTTARQLRFAPEDGMHVVVRGRLSVYDAKGEYQIVCDAIEPHGLGALQAAFEQLKRRLSAEGLFDAARKRPLPLLPRRIGVVTSIDGAALRDVLRVLTVRHPTARVVIRGARVQGDGAAADIIRALAHIARVPELDVVILGRGGGSAEDLWAFNDEALARAIAACPIPVVSAVGHEVDFTIADFVADVRAATPSNAAELVVDRADNFHSRIDRADRRLRGAVRLQIATRRQRLDRACRRLDQWPVAVVMRSRDCQRLVSRLPQIVTQRIGRLSQRFDGLRHRLGRQDARQRLAALRARTSAAEGRLGTLITRHRVAASARANQLAAGLHALSPLAVLGRGYAVCWNATKTSIIRSSNEVAPGAAVRVTLADGELGCMVEETLASTRSTKP